VPVRRDAEQEAVRLTIDGEAFEAGERLGEPGVHDIAWLSGPNPGYGFSVARSERGSLSAAELEAEARGFLAQVDPATGLID
jgi:hypothetical protein